MNQISILSYIILTMSCLTACSEEKTQSVDWYVEHPEILKKEVEKCKLKTLEELVKDKHCAVINLAQRKVFDDHEINAPIPKFDIHKWKRQ